MLHFARASCGHPLSWPYRVAPCRVLCYLSHLPSHGFFSFLFSLDVLLGANSKLLTGNKRAGVVCAKKAWPWREDQIDFAQNFQRAAVTFPCTPHAHRQAHTPARTPTRRPACSAVGNENWSKKLARQIRTGETGVGMGGQGHQNSTPTHVCCGHGHGHANPQSTRFH